MYITGATVTKQLVGKHLYHPTMHQVAEQSFGQEKAQVRSTGNRHWKGLVENRIKVVNWPKGGSLQTLA